LSTLRVVHQVVSRPGRRDGGEKLGFRYVILRRICGFLALLVLDWSSIHVDI